MDEQFPGARGFLDAGVAGYREAFPEMAQAYIVEITRELSARCDTLQINGWFAELDRSAGEELLEKLNGLIRQRFLITPVLDIFLQAFTHQYLSCLLQRDKETCRKTFHTKPKQ